MKGSWHRLFVLTIAAALSIGLLIGWISGFVEMESSRTGSTTVFVAIVVIAVISLIGFVIEFVRVD